jgi:hypothetical protein
MTAFSRRPFQYTSLEVINVSLSGHVGGASSLTLHVLVLREIEISSSPTCDLMFVHLLQMRVQCRVTVEPVFLQRLAHIPDAAVRGIPLDTASLADCAIGSKVPQAPR